MCCQSAGSDIIDSDISPRSLEIGILQLGTELSVSGGYVSNFRLASIGFGVVGTEIEKEGMNICSVFVGHELRRSYAAVICVVAVRIHSHKGPARFQLNSVQIGLTYQKTPCGTVLCAYP